MFSSGGFFWLATATTALVETLSLRGGEADLKEAQIAVDRLATVPTDSGSVAAPSGVVTFLFTDIEGSTRRWEADADAMRAALLAHDEVLRTAIEAHGGFLFSHTEHQGLRHRLWLARSFTATRRGAL